MLLHRLKAIKTFQEKLSGKYLKSWRSMSASVISDVKHRKPTVKCKETASLLTIDFPHFSEILPYRYFDPEDNLFVSANSLGFGIEMMVLNGADEKIINSLSDMLRYKINEHYDLQFILWGSQEIGELVDNAYQASLGQADIFGQLAKTSVHYYKKGARDGLKNPRNLPVSLRDYRVFMFVSKKTAYHKAAVNEMVGTRHEILSELMAMGMDAHELNHAEFITVVQAWINPDPDEITRRSPVREAYTTLNEQVINRGFELVHEPDHLVISTDLAVDRVSAAECENQPGEKPLVEVTNLSLKALPEKFALWMSADNFVNVFRASQAIRCPFLISIHARIVPQAEAKTTAQSRFLSMQKKASSVYAKYISGTEETAAEWKKIRDDLASDEVRLVKTFFNVTLFSKKGEAKKDEAAAISCFRYNGIELFNTRYMQLQSFLATLPFLMTEGLFGDLQKARRLRTLTTWNLANLLPILADYKMGHEGLLLTSFRNQISFFDPFSEHLPIANYNIAVAATSGAGKSFLIQALLTHVLSVGGKCFVIDLGQSYRKLCEMVGGVYLDYSSLRLNPFTNVQDIQSSSEQIRDLMSVLASPSGELEDVQEEYLRQAINLAWEANHTDTTVDNILEALAQLNQTKNDKRIEDLITLLDKYSSHGAYPEVFNKCSAIPEDVNFVVLELGDLQNKPALMKAVLFALILIIEEQIYQSPRNQRKMVVIDEAWRLLSGDNKAAARFIEKGYRTARRHKGSFVTITQGIEDFLKSSEAKACWNCSDIKITMLQNAKAFDDFMANNKNYFDPYAESLIRHFNEAKTNGFSEFMLQLGQVYSFYRLFVDPFSRIMFSSAGDAFEAVNREKAKGNTIAESILAVARQQYADEF